MLQNGARNRLGAGCPFVGRTYRAPDLERHHLGRGCAMKDFLKFGGCLLAIALGMVAVGVIAHLSWDLIRSGWGLV